MKLIEDNKEITRNSKEYVKYKNKVKLRDRFCQCCGSKEDLEVHHPFAYHEYESLRADVKNGVVLCKKCHKEYHKQYGRKKNNNPITFAQFLRDNSTFKNVQTSFIDLSKRLENDKKILKRDRRCMHVKCKSIYNLEVHHDENIKDGGITLCKQCHSDYHKKYGYEKSCNLLTLEDFLIPNGEMAYDIIIKRDYKEIIFDEKTRKCYYVTRKYGNVEHSDTEHGEFIGNSYWPTSFSRLTLDYMKMAFKGGKCSIKKLKSFLGKRGLDSGHPSDDREFDKFIKDLKIIGIIIESEEEGYFEIKKN